MEQYTAKPVRKKRSHTSMSVACDPCRKRHQGCDNTVPCSRCIAAGREDECIKRPRRKRFPENDCNPNSPSNCYELLTKNFCPGDIKIESIEEKIPPETFKTINCQPEIPSLKSIYKTINSPPKKPAAPKKMKMKYYFPPLIINIKPPTCPVDASPKSNSNTALIEESSDKEKVDAIFRSSNAIKNCNSVDQLMAIPPSDEGIVVIEAQDEDDPSKATDFWNPGSGLDGLTDDEIFDWLRYGTLGSV
jgi:hypothetical protein